MRHRTEFHADFPGADRAERVARALAVEAADLGDERSTATVTHEQCELTITIEARDLTALRAAVNTWSGLLAVGEAADAPFSGA